LNLQPPRTSWLVQLRLNEPRAFSIQIGLLLALAAGAAFVLANLHANVERLNMRVGFEFLHRVAGFDIAQSLIPYSETSTYLQAFWVALLNTVLLGGLSIAVGTVLGLAVALMRLSKNPLLALVALVYVEAVRNIPLLLQLFFWYFTVLGPLPLPRQSLHLLDLAFLNKRGLSLPWPVAEPGLPAFLALATAGLVGAGMLVQFARKRRVATGQPSPILWMLAGACLVVPVAATAVTGRPVTWDIPRLAGFNIAGGMVVIPEFVAMAVGMTVYGSAFIAELIRGGVATVGKGQTEAGMALGLTRGRIYATIIIPQVFRAVLPPLMGQYISIFKNSSLAAAIGYPDLMLIFAGTALNQTGQPLEIMAMTMMSYLLINLAISSAGNLANRRVLSVER
jgi:general L-amino acid transport system permease protein